MWAASPSCLFPVWSSPCVLPVMRRMRAGATMYSTLLALTRFTIHVVSRVCMGMHASLMLHYQVVAAQQLLQSSTSRGATLPAGQRLPNAGQSSLLSRRMRQSLTWASQLRRCPRAVASRATTNCAVGNTPRLVFTCPLRSRTPCMHALNSCVGFVWPWQFCARNCFLERNDISGRNADE